MATSKRIFGDYNITTVDSSDNITITTHTVTVNGNLDVVGNITYIETSELKVDDPFITVAANNTGASEAVAAFQEQGLVAQTSANTFAGLRFDNNTLSWQASPNVDANGAPITPYQTLAVGNVPEPGNPQYSVQYHAPGNIFAGDTKFGFDPFNTRITLEGILLLGNLGVMTQTAIANTVQMYHVGIGSGGTGVYVKTPGVEDELVSKTKAIVFGIIF